MEEIYMTSYEKKMKRKLEKLRKKAASSEELSNALAKSRALNALAPRLPDPINTAKAVIGLSSSFRADILRRKANKIEKRLEEGYYNSGSDDDRDSPTWGGYQDSFWQGGW